MNNTLFNEYAAIDLGSNSFHMIIVRKDHNAFQTIYKNKQYVHLADGLDQNFDLSNESIEKAVSALALFAERLQNFPMNNVRVVGTYALRIAKNKHQFLNAANKVFPYPIEIISGQEEARLIYIGAINSESVQNSDVKFIIDVGGGSTEIAIGTESTPIITESRPMGCITYAKRFFPNQEIHPRAFEHARLAAAQQVEKMIELVRSKNISIAFGSSGTVKSIYNILLDLGVVDGIITLKRLEDIISYFMEFDHFNEINYPSLSQERKMIIVSGLAIFYGVFKAFGIQELHYTQSSLREGVLYEMTEDSLNIDDVCKNTVISLMRKYHIDKSHANQVKQTAEYLLKQWEHSLNTKIDPALESILYWATFLHEVGLNINFTNLHKHSAYILKNSNMPGFNVEEQLLLSTLVRYHRKTLKLENIPYFSLFDQKQIYPLLQILRIAILINNQRSKSITTNMFELEVDSNDQNKIKLKIDSEFASNNRLILLDLEQEQKYWQNSKIWQLEIIY